MLRPPRSRKSSVRRAGSRKRAVEAARAAGVPASAARKARSADRRDAILAAALDEFSSRGFEAARLDDVARRAGVAKGTIYLYFRDKESLFQELVRAMLTPLVGTIEAMGQADYRLRGILERIGCNLPSVTAGSISRPATKEQSSIQHVYRSVIH